MMKYGYRYQCLLILLILLFTACGSGNETKEKAQYLVEKDLGLYIGYQKVALVTPDGRLHDPAYNLVTSQIAQGVYLTSQPDAKYDYRYRVRLKRYYFDGDPQPEGSTVEIGLSFNPEAYETYYARIPGNLYY